MKNSVAIRVTRVWFGALVGVCMVWSAGRVPAQSEGSSRSSQERSSLSVPTTTTPTPISTPTAPDALQQRQQTGAEGSPPPSPLMVVPLAQPQVRSGPSQQPPQVRQGPGVPALGQKPRAMTPRSFDIARPASQQDWSYFKQSSFAWKRELWDYHRRLHRGLSSWHWVWRIGWVQACNTMEYFRDLRCQEILRAGEQDKALVVRSAVVVNYQKLFRGSESSDIVKRLEIMFEDPRNYKNGRPLYITKQIVYAIKEVGGEYSLLAASKLAKSHPQIDNYYQKIGRSL